MRIGMAVNSGMRAEKLDLAELLEQAAELSIEIGLWVEGRPFDVGLRQLAKQLEEYEG